MLRTNYPIASKSLVQYFNHCINELKVGDEEHFPCYYGLTSVGEVSTGMKGHVYFLATLIYRRKRSRVDRVEVTGPGCC